MVPSLINSDFLNANVVFVAANGDITSTSGKGADRAPAAIRRCLDEQIEFREPRTGIVTTERLRLAWHDLGDLNGGRTPEAQASAVTRVASELATIWRAKKYPLLIGGDHSMSIGALQGWASLANATETTILQIDAHHDLRRDDGDCVQGGFGPLSHACALRAAVEAGYRLTAVGVRSFSAEEEMFLKRRRGVRTFYWGLTRSFVPPSVDEILKSIRTEQVYITIDVDGFDPAVMPATGTPVSGGLGWWYGLDLLQEVCREKRVVGADICEVAPRAGETLTEYNAAQLAYCLITWAWAKR